MKDLRFVPGMLLNRLNPASQAARDVGERPEGIWIDSMFNLEFRFQLVQFLLPPFPPLSPSPSSPPSPSPLPPPPLFPLSPSFPLPSSPSPPPPPSPGTTWATDKARSPTDLIR